MNDEDEDEDEEELSLFLFVMDVACRLYQVSETAGFCYYSKYFPFLPGIIESFPSSGDNVGTDIVNKVNICKRTIRWSLPFALQVWDKKYSGVLAKYQNSLHLNSIWISS